MNHKILVGVSILVALLLLLPPVASNGVNDEHTEFSVVVNEEQRDDPESVSEVTSQPEGISDEPIIKRKIQQKPYEEQLRENRQRMFEAFPSLPVPEFDEDNFVMKAQDLQHSDLTELPAELKIDRDYRVQSFRPEPIWIEPNPNPSSRTDADLEITKIEWTGDINPGWASFTDSTNGNQPYIGGFMVDEKTTITFKVRNNNPSVPVSGVSVNLGIWDYYAGIPLIKIPTQVNFSINTANLDVTYDFTPPSANLFYIASEIIYPNDLDPSNNAMNIGLIQTLIWSSDFETGAGKFGNGSQTPNAWTGNFSTDNQWHKTDSAENQASSDHTTQWSWYHGKDASTDSYVDTNHTYLVSPKIDMGDISDGQEEFGILPYDYFYTSTTPVWAGMFTGEAEVDTDFSDTDILWTYQYTDDDEKNWKESIDKFSRRGYVWGNWETIFGQITPTWNPNIMMTGTTTANYGYPFNFFVADGAGGNQPSDGATNWTKVQFRIHFDGDDESDTESLPGYYADDFVTWGYQHWRPPYNIRLSDMSNVVSNGIPILYPNVECTFDITMQNLGLALSNVPMKISIQKNLTDVTPIYTNTKYVASLAEKQEAAVPWAWTPTAEGDYYILIEAGDLTKDYTPTQNVYTLKVYVRDPNGRVLVVDDDDSVYTGGLFWVGVEEKMLRSLDDLNVSYNVFNAAQNESGPTKSIMDQYEAVIWMTGLDNEYSKYGRNPDWTSDWGITIKPQDQTQLSNYMNAGDVNLWMISPGVLYDLTDSESAKTPTGFLKDYLHLAYCNANETEYNTAGDITKQGTPKYLYGESGSLAEGATYLTYDKDLDPPYGLPERFNDIGSIIEADSQSKVIFNQDVARLYYNSLQYSGTYKLVYFAFNYYLIADRGDCMNLTYRVLNFFGLEGGLDLERDDSASKTVDFGETVSFKFKITNLGRLAETMNIKLVSPSPAALPNGWTITLNDKATTATTNELAVGGNSGVRYFYLNMTAPDTYLDSSGNLDPAIKNITWGSEIQLKIRVESKNFPDNFYDHASCKVTTGLSKNIRLTTLKTSDTIDISQEFDPLTEVYVDYDIFLQNVTNGGDDANVLVALDSPSNITAEIYQAETEITDQTVTLTPLQDTEVTLRVSADDTTPMGDYNITFKVMDDSGTDLLNSTILTTTVEQFYNIALVTSPTETYSRIVDPNTMTGDYQTEDFEVTLENYGNGPDTVNLFWEENRDSPKPIPVDWEDSLVEIYDKDGGSQTIDEITVPAYNPVSDTPGTKTILVKVKIPKEDEEGRFWIDLVAISSAPGDYFTTLQRDDFEVEAYSTFKIEMVTPELAFVHSNCYLKHEGAMILDVDTIYVNDEIEVFLTIENTGTGPATNVDLDISVSLDALQLKTHEEIITISAGMDHEYTWRFTPTEPGNYVFTGKIDPNKELIGDYVQGNEWNNYQLVKDDKSDPLKNNPPTIMLITEDGTYFEVGSDIVIEGTYSDPDDDEVYIMVNMELPDGSETGFIELSILGEEEIISMKVYSDGRWKFRLDTTDATEADEGTYTFYFKAVDADPYGFTEGLESSVVSLDVILVGEGEMPVTGGDGDGGDDARPMSMGLFSYDILIIIIIIIVIILVLLFVFLMPKKRRAEEEAYPPYGAPAPGYSAPVRCSSCGVDVPPGAWSCPSCGAAVPQPQAQPQPIYCSCSAVIPEGAQTCPACGRPAPAPVTPPPQETAPYGAEPQYCASCRAQVPPGAPTCPACGAPAPAPQPQAAAAPAAAPPGPMPIEGAQLPPQAGAAPPAAQPPVADQPPTAPVSAGVSQIPPPAVEPAMLPPAQELPPEQPPAQPQVPPPQTQPPVQQAPPQQPAAQQAYQQPPQQLPQQQPPQAQSAPPAAAPMQGDMLTCPTCGVQIAYGAPYCQYCNTQLNW